MNHPYFIARITVKDTHFKKEYLLAGLAPLKEKKKKRLTCIFERGAITILIIT